MIEAKIPYGLNKDLAGAYNAAMRSADTEWVLLLDHDVFLSCNPYWYEMCLEAVNKVGDDVGLITCVTVTHPKSHGAQDADITEHSRNIDDHINVAKQLWKKYGTELKEIKTFKLAGFFFLVRKEIWKKLLFKSRGQGIDKIDWDYCRRLLKKGYKIYKMPGLYVYHRRDIRKERFNEV
jgi:GT2 family glycosyltransferase